MRWRMLPAIAFALLCGTLPAKAADKIVLRMSDGMPAGHILDRLVIEPFIQAVSKATNGQVEIQHFPAEQLGKSKDLLILTQHGVTDIAYVVPSYVSDKMPLSAVTELPGLFRTTCQGTAALQALTREGALLDRLEFAPNKVHMLIAFVMPIYQIQFSSLKSLDRLKDIAGLKIRSAGGAMDFTIRSMGGVPVRVAPPDMYESMSRGTLDGALLPYQSLVSYSLQSLVKSGTTGQNFGTVAVTFAIGTDRWNALPADVRAAMTDVGDRINARVCNDLDIAETQATETVEASGGKLTALTDSDRTVLESKFDTIKSDWASKLDKKGKAGSEVLAAFTAAVAAAH